MHMQMQHALEVAALKSEARRLYLKIVRRSDMSCGARLTDFIRPDVPANEARFNEIMDRLREIDPDARALSTAERAGAR
jgi:hypothetical protein